MLANSRQPSVQTGLLSEDVHLSAASLLELLNFIAVELPSWRDRSDREAKTSETSLTSQLCAHLNSSARLSNGWDFLQFRIEEPDEQAGNRKIDLIPAPCGAVIWIDGRRHIDFDPLLPIECKRLPTPTDHRRDEREYVISRHASSGGIQRFKAGHHGARHRLGTMIAYIQQEKRMFWNTRIAEWIKDLVETGQPGWSLGDLLHLDNDDESLRLAVFRSAHARENKLPIIELRHLWIEMN